jgi:hypothetical protein
MAVFTYSVNVQLVETVDLVIDDVASIEAPGAAEVAIYSNLDAALDFRKAETYRAWESLYMAWKKFAYDPFDGASAGVPHYLCVPLDAPYPEYRIITTNILLLVDTYVGIGIGADYTALDAIGKNTLNIRVAYNKLRDYYLEQVK